MALGVPCIDSGSPAVFPFRVDQPSVSEATDERTKKQQQRREKALRSGGFMDRMVGLTQAGGQGGIDCSGDLGSLQQTCISGSAITIPSHGDALVLSW